LRFPYLTNVLEKKPYINERFVINSLKTKIIASTLWHKILNIIGYMIIAYFILLGILIVRDAKASGAYTPIKGIFPQLQLCGL